MSQAAIDTLVNMGSGLLARLASEVSDLRCDFIAINDEADVQDFSENGYEVAGLKQPIYISYDDQAVAEFDDQFVIQNMYTEVAGDNDDSVEAAPAGSVNIAVLTSLRLDKLAAMHSAAA